MCDLCHGTAACNAQTTLSFALNHVARVPPWPTPTPAARWSAGSNARPEAPRLTPPATPARVLPREPR